MKTKLILTTAAVLLLAGCDKDDDQAGDWREVNRLARENEKLKAELQMLRESAERDREHARQLDELVTATRVSRQHAEQMIQQRIRLAVSREGLLDAIDKYQREMDPEAAEATHRLRLEEARRLMEEQGD